MQTAHGDTLLYWLSARGEVGDLKLRDACKRLEPDSEQSRPLYHRTSKALLALGHVEMNETSPNNHRWLTLPPYALQIADGNLLLMGARLPKWQKRLGAELPVGFEQRSQPECQGPERWSVKKIPTWLETYLTWIAPERGLDLLYSLPTLETALNSLLKVDVGQVPLQNYDFKRKEWHQTKSPLRPGLYSPRDRAFGVWYLIEEDQDQAYEARSREHKAIVFWWLRSKRPHFYLGYSLGKQDLIMSSARYPLPLLIDRALRSASGLCPRYEAGHWIYSKIDLPRAQRMADILATRMERL